MSQPPDGPWGDHDPAPEPRPRPSWGKPGPDDAASTAPIDAPRAPQTWGYSEPDQRPPPPYAPTPGAPQQSWPQQDWSGSGAGPQQSPAPPQQGWGSPSASQYGKDLGRHEQAYAQYYGEKPRTGMSVASMVLGILAFLGCWIPFVSYAAVLMALLAIIFGIVGLRRSGRAMAITGLILGGLALVASIIASIIWTTIFVDAARVAQDCADEDPSLGRAYEQCVTDRTDEIIPFQ